MFIFFLLFCGFFGLYYYLCYQVILLNDLEQIFSQTANKAQQDLREYSDLLLKDLVKCYQPVLIIILAATILTFLWILLLKYNAKFIIWLSIFSLPILISVGLYYSTTTYIHLSRNNLNNSNNNNNNQFQNIDDEITNQILTTGNNNNDDNKKFDLQNEAYDKAIQTILTAEVMSYVQNETLWLVISITLFVILLILMILLHSLRERVRLSIALIRQASKAINGVKSTLIFPILPRAFGIACLIWGVVISLLIISASHPTYQVDSGPLKGASCNPRNFNRFNNNHNNINNNNTTASNLNPKRPECVASQLLNRQHVWKYHALNIFATLWIIHFISGLSQTILAGAFASYYWAYRKPQDVPFFAVSASSYRAIKNHLGDIAFGSFLIATIRYIRLIIEFIDNRIRSKTSSPAINNPTTRNMTCFFRIFFWLLDRFLKYIDRNAYILMSMYGEGYLRSAKRAVELLYKNSTRAIVLDYVTYFVLLVSRLLITILAGFVTAQEQFTGQLHYKWLPIVLVVIGTHFIAKGLFSVYSMAVDTLFICFLIDSTQNDGSVGKPYFMAKDLRKILKKNTSGM